MATYDSATTQMKHLHQRPCWTRLPASGPASIMSNTEPLPSGGRTTRHHLLLLRARWTRLRIYNRALSAAEVSDLYNGVTPTSTPTQTPLHPATHPCPRYTSADATPTQTPSPTATPNCGVDGLVAHYMMDENGGTTLVDSSPPANDGTIYGSPTWVSRPERPRAQPEREHAVRPCSQRCLSQHHGAHHARRLGEAGPADHAGPHQESRQRRHRRLRVEPLYHDLDVADQGRSSGSTRRPHLDTYRVNSTTVYPSDGNTWIHVAGTYDGTNMRIYVQRCDGRHAGRGPAGRHSQQHE